MIKPWVTTLYGRLVLALLGLVLAFSVLFIVVTLVNTHSHLELVDQRNNRHLAANILEVTGLKHTQALSRTDAKRIFHEVMAINPRIDVYLLDQAGGILHYDAPQGSLKRMRVETGPIDRYLAEPDALPLFGDDPKHATGKSIFSAAPFRSEGELGGYLYAVLGGASYGSLEQLVGSGSIVRQSLLLALIGSLAITALGLLGLHRLTAPLRELVSAIEHFRSGGFQNAIPLGEPNAAYDDNDVGRITKTVHEMSSEIAGHLETLHANEASRQELIENFLHDFKTPLATLRLHLEALHRADALPANERTLYYERAVSYSDKLSQLSTDLFELVRLNTDDLPLTKEPFPFHELVMDILNRYAGTFACERINIAANVPRQGPPVALDVPLIERALTNLIDNALKYGRDGEFLGVDVQYSADAVKVRVVDRGPGIPHEEQERVFERFYRMDPEEAAADGSGLGLAIAKRIIELHAGSISLISHPGKGTVFIVSLPLTA